MLLTCPNDEWISKLIDSIRNVNPFESFGSYAVLLKMDLEAPHHIQALKEVRINDAHTVRFLSEVLLARIEKRIENFEDISFEEVIVPDNVYGSYGLYRLSSLKELGLR